MCLHLIKYLTVSSKRSFKNVYNNVRVERGQDSIGFIHYPNFLLNIHNTKKQVHCTLVPFVISMVEWKECSVWKPEIWISILYLVLTNLLGDFRTITSPPWTSVTLDVKKVVEPRISDWQQYAMVLHS